MPAGYFTHQSPRSHHFWFFGKTDSYQLEKGHALSKRFFWFKQHSNFLAIKLKFLKVRNNKVSRLMQSFTVGETNFKQILRIRSQLDAGTENFIRKENVSLLQTSRTFKDIDKQLKVLHKKVNVVDHLDQKNCVTMLGYNLEKSQYSSLQVRTSARKKE